MAGRSRDGTQALPLDPHHAAKAAYQEEDVLMHADVQALQTNWPGTVRYVSNAVVMRPVDALLTPCRVIYTLRTTMAHYFEKDFSSAIAERSANMSTPMNAPSVPAVAC